MSKKVLEFKNTPESISLGFFGNTTMSSKDAFMREKSAYEKGKEDASGEFNQKIAGMREEVQDLESQILGSIEKRFEQVLQEVNGRMPGLVLSLVKRVLGNVEPNEEEVTAIVNDALQEISRENESIEVSLSERNYGLLKEYNHKIEERYPKVSFKVSDVLGNADCLVHTRFGLIDATLDTKLKKVEQELKEA